VDSPENIPLQEAVDRGLIPCASCGAKGAEVRRAGGKDHFLCSKCARGGSTWVWILAGLTFAVVALVVLLLRMRTSDGDHTLPPPPPGGAAARDPEPWAKETERLLKQGRFREARERTQELIDKMPKEPVLNLTMGRCLMNLGETDAAIPYLQVAAKSEFKGGAEIMLGMAYKKIGHAAQALPYLEKPFTEEPSLHGELADVYIELERYADALKLLPENPTTPGALWSRHRALLYSGKPDEATRLLEGRDEDEAANLRISQLREAGDFEGARKILAAQIAKLSPGSAVGLQLRRSERQLAIESGDLARLEAVAASFDADPDRLTQAEGAWARAIAHLSAGRREAAKGAAWEFLEKYGRVLSTLRLERMMMRHLVGELKDADLEDEAKQLSRFQANDLLWYLALATGDRARAEAALAATPGHNYPYHAIRRLLPK
jgi:tetratricopeptide (TPR) repeat protein